MVTIINIKGAKSFYHSKRKKNVNIISTSPLRLSGDINAIILIVYTSPDFNKES